MIDKILSKMKVEFERLEEFPPDIIRAKQLRDGLHRMRLDPDEHAGFKLPWMGLDFKFANDLNIVTGIPGSGKSVWLDNVVIYTMMKHGRKWAIFSPEHTPETHMRQLLEISYGGRFDGRFGSKKPLAEMIDQFLDIIQPKLFMIRPEKEEDLCIESILAKIEYLAENHGVDAFVLDPYNEFAYTRPRTMSETEYVSLFLSRVRKLITNHGKMSAWIVAHPTKLHKNDKGIYSPPSAYDIAGSAHFFNKADHIICVHREKDRDKNPDNIVDLIVQKVKRSNVGTLGSYQLKFLLQSSRYADIPRYTCEEAQAPSTGGEYKMPYKD